MEEYILKLKKFVDNDFEYLYKDNVITVIEDWEIRYEYDIRNKKIYRIERGNYQELQQFNEKKFLRLQFAFIIDGIFGEERNYNDMQKFSEKNNLKEIKELAKEYFEDKYYSIGSREEEKISLIYGEDYKLIFRYKNKDYIIEENSDKKIVFRIFYVKLFYTILFETKIKRYIDLFGERFTKDEIIKFWGYPIGIR